MKLRKALEVIFSLVLLGLSGRLVYLRWVEGRAPELIPDYGVWGILLINVLVMALVVKGLVENGSSQ